MPAKKKGAVKKAATVPKAKINFALDEQKIAQIQRCLAKGKLSISVSKVDLAKGRVRDAWLYD
jgi:hypothetical protein